MLHVRIGNVDFHGFTTNGFLIGPDGFKGWEGSAATKRDAAERSGRHGAFPSPAFKSARLVRLSGHALADSVAELEHMGEVLAGVGQSEQTIVVTTASGTRWGRGSVEGEIKFDRVGGALEATFSLSLFMPDPFKYGDLRTFTSTGSSVSASHRGNTDALSVFDVTGSWPGGYRLRRLDTLEVFTVGQALTSGTHRVDFRTQQVTVNGVVQLGAVVRPESWLVGGGVRVPWQIESYLSAGSGTAVQSLHDTFI